MKTQTKAISLPERLTQRLRQPVWKKAVSALLLSQFALWSVQVQGAEGTWILNNAGNWTGTPANWQGGFVPNAVGDVAIFRNDITAARTITLNAPITLGGLKSGDLVGGSVFTYGGTNTLTMAASSGNAFINKYGSATDVIANTAALSLSSATNFNIFTGAFDVNAPVSGSVNIIKNGAGSLTFRNTTGFTGDFVLNFGTLNFSGASAASSSQLGTGSGGIKLVGNARQDLNILGLRSNGPATDGTVVYNGNNDVIVSGAVAINVDRNFDTAANDRVNHELDSLTINGGILRVTSGNSHRLTFSGTTMLLGQTNVIEPLANGTATLANLTLSGVIDDGAATSNLIKEGAGRLAVTNTANTYGGVTAIKNGILQLNAGANLGAGKTYVNGGVLSVADTATLDGVSAGGGLVLVGQLGTSRYSLPNIGYFGTTAINSSNPLNVNVPIAGMILGVDGVTGTASTNAADIDLSYVAGGNQRVWLGNVVGNDRSYTGTLTNGSSGDLRLLAGSNNLIIAGSADRLGGAGATNNLIFGLDHADPINITGNHIGQATALLSGTTAGSGIVSVRVNNSNTLGTVTINRGQIVEINGTGVTTALGTSAVTILGGTLRSDATTDAKFGNTDFKLYAGSTLLLDNGAVAAANTDRRLINTSDIDLSSSTFRLIGDGGAAGNNSSQTVATIDYRGGSNISVDRDGAVGSLTTLTTGSLNRVDRGTLNLRSISGQTTIFGTTAGTQKLISTTAPVVNNGMVGANIVLWGGTTSNDGTTPLFATYDTTHGFQAAAFTHTNTLTGVGTGSIVTYDNTAYSGAGASVQALRIRTTANTSTFNASSAMTIGAASSAGQGAGLFLAHTADNTVTHTTPFNFGTQEALLYASTTGGSSVINLTGVLNGTGGLTKFGDGVLQLSGANTYTGTTVLNAGELRLNSISAVGGTATAPNQIDMNGGSLYLAAANRYYTNITLRDNARLGNVNVASTVFNNLTIAQRTGTSAPLVLDMRNQAGGNITTAYGTLDMQGPGMFAISHPLQVNSGITGSANIDKYQNERLIIAGDSSSYTGNITAYAGVLQSFAIAPSAKPFGNSNTITINPGAHLILAAPTNINGGQVTINSDHGGISTIGQFFVADPATALPAITLNSSAPWKASLGIGAVGFSVDIDQSSLFGGNTYLGAALGYTGIYTGNLTPSASGYLLGGSQGTIRLEKPLTGSTNAIIGISMTETGGRSDQVVNNSGGSVQFTSKMAYTGNTILNPGPLLRISAKNALSDTGDVIFSGGQLRADPASGQNRMITPISLTNKIIMTADSTIQMENSAYDFRIGGNIELAPGSTGIVRALTIGSDQPGAAANNAGIVYLDGGISDGVGGSGNHFLKNGVGTLFFTGTNTYTGTTTIQQGLIGINTDSDWGQSTGSILSPNGGIAVWENSFTTAKNYSAHGGNLHVDVAGGLTLTQDASSVIDGTSSIVKRGLGTLILNGENAVTGLFAGDGILQFNSLVSTANSAATNNYTFGGDVTLGGANNGTRYTGGTMRFNFTGTTTRGFVFQNNSNTGFSGGIDITAGNTLTASGIISQGTELDFGFKTGAGTLILTAANTWRGLVMNEGVLQFATSTPWANSTGTAADNTFIEMMGGNMRAINVGANITLATGASTTTYNYGGGMTLSMGSGSGFAVEFAATNLIRQNQGTLVLQTIGSTTLGAAGATNAARMIVTNAVNGSLARASATNNGIFGAHLLGANDSGVAFFLQNNATTGFTPYSGSVNSNLTGLAPNAIADITSDQTLSGVNSIYALRTTADISGGILNVTAIDNVKSGGVLLNGSKTISSGLVFDPTSSVLPGTGIPGEGLIYVKAGENATISGSITANALTKFGDGTLTISGKNGIASDVSVQSGIMKLAGSNVFSRMNSELNINAGATLDLNGYSVSTETIGANNRLVATTLIGGTITNSSATSATLAMSSPVSSVYAGVISGNTKLLKAGTGTLTLNGYSASTPDSGVNKHTGGTEVYGYNTTGGINVNNSTLALGGGNGGASQVSLYSGQLGLFISNGTTGINGTQGMQFNNQVVRLGAESNLLTLNVYGPALINVNQATPSSNTAFGQGNIITFGAMNLSNATLQVTGGNLYRIRAEGPTTILGSQAAIQTNAAGTTGGALELFGAISGSGTLTKLGDGTLFGIVINNPSNSYSGGTNIVAGDVQVTATSGTPLGTGPVRVFPEGTLRLSGNGSVNGVNLTTMSRVNAMGAVMLDDNFTPAVLNSTNFSSIYNTSLQLAQPYFTQALNLATIGDGRAFLGTGINAEVAYTATTLGAGIADAWNPGVGVYRIAPATSSFAFSGADNVLTGTSYLQVGPQRNNVLGVITNGGNILVLRNSNDYSGGTQITKGSSIYIETGGRATGETPLGSGDIEVYGELRIRSSQGSLWNANTTAMTNTINLRPGGTVRLHDGDGTLAAQFLGAGEQGRWGDNVGIDLNGGNFIYNGAPNLQSSETIGAVVARKAGQLQVFRNSTASAATLNVSDISRDERGVLSLQYNTGFLGLNVATPLSYERIVTGTIAGSSVARAGTTLNGAGVVNGGMVAPWIIDRTTNSFVGYDPTLTTGTGFQPLLSTASPGAGQLAYSKIISASPITTLAAGDIADITTAAMTLGQNPTLYALRTSQNISPTATFNTITLTGGGLIGTGGTINPTGAITAGVVSPMTLNFGTGGADEAFIYNSGTLIIQAQINAAKGLTKFGAGQLQIHGINPGIGDSVVLHEGITIIRVPYSGSGSAVGQVLNGQDIIVNGGTLNMQSILANAAGTVSEIASNPNSSQALLDSKIFIRGDAAIRNNGAAQYVRVSDLTIGNSAGATNMNGNSSITLNLQSGIWVRGTTTLSQEAVINSTFDGFSQSTLAGVVTGQDLVKYGNGTVTMLNGANDYAGGTTIWGSTAATTVSNVASAYRGVGTPFSTGDINIQPGGLLRIADIRNIASNAVYLRSDGIGLGGIGLGYNGVLPQIITTGTPTAGQIKVESTGPFDGVLTLDYGIYTQTLNPSTLGNGNWWIGNSQQAESYYFNKDLGVTASGKYLLGGGGSQSGISLGSISVGSNNVRTPLFENIFSGGSAGQVKIEIGAQTGNFIWNAPSFVNGNSAFIILPTRNKNLVGDVRVNTNTTLAIGNNFALGNGRLIMNGGALRPDLGSNNIITSQLVIPNDVVLQGDWSVSNVGNELAFSGNIAMSDVVTAGATRIWNFDGSVPSGVGLEAGSTTKGVISGAIGSNLIKRGARQLTLRGANTYQGYTQIDRGEVVAVGNIAPNIAGPLGISESPIVLGVESTNNVGSLVLGGKYDVSRDITVVGAAGTGFNVIRSSTNEIATVSGGISIATSAVATLGAISPTQGVGTGGRLEILGPISGAGGVQFGTTAAVTSYGGTVAILGNSNGYGLNTYSGGTTIQSSRVEIGVDTYFTGPTANPTIISGPFGTGALTITAGEGGNGSTFLAVGGPRTIYNAFNATSTDSNSTWRFSGEEALTFVRNWDISSAATLRNRTFDVRNVNQPTTLSGVLSASGTNGVSFIKAGSGMLILTGSNTFATSSTTGIQINSGILSINGDAALGAGTSVRLNGGTLAVSNTTSTARQLILQAASGIDVASGATYSLSAATTGAFGITKSGAGTLMLNNTANTITTLTLGGRQQLTSGVGFFSHTGGVVGTTAASGTPFVAAGGSITINSGTLALADAAVQTLSVATLNYGAAAQIATGAGDTLTLSTAFARQGAFNSVNYGTITINPAAISNLGSSEKVIISAGAPANTTLGAGSTLTVPSVFVAQSGAGQDANFARYDSTNGLMVHNATVSTTLATTAPATIANITAADTVGAAANDIVEVYGLRTDSNISGFDSSVLLRVLGGGLIINGNTAPTISSNLRFGTASTLAEAIVYVRDQQSSASVISGNVSARDFTKTGPGILELAGSANILNTTATRLPVISVQNGTFRFANGSSQFSNAFRPSAINSLLGSYVLNVNEAGVFDLNGLDTQIGGLTGNGTVTNNGAGNANLRVSNGFGVDPTFSGLIRDGSSVVSLTKTGNGVLSLNGHGSYTGGTTVEGGRVTSSIGSTATIGRLELQTVTALGSGPITLAGGEIRFNAATLLNSAQNTTDVSDGIDTILFGGSKGYDVTVSSSGYSNGILLPENTTSYINAAGQNAMINSLTLNAPILTSTAGLVFVKGATTINQDTVIRTAGGRLFLQGQLNAEGQTITKTGANDIVVSHTEAGLGQNKVGMWKIYGGILNARSASGASNPLGANPFVEINGGSTNNGLLLNTDGDGTAVSERVTTYANTNLRFGSDLPITSSEFVSSGAGRLAVDRILGNNDDKTVVVNNIEVRGALGTPYVYFLTSNGSSIWVNGTTDFSRDFNLQADGTAVTFNGVISGNGSLNRKSNGANVFFNAENTYDGGTFFTGGGRNLLGSYEGNRVNLSDTAKLGMGHVYLGPLATYQINAEGNLRDGQNIYVSGNLSMTSTLSLAADLSLEQIRLRAGGLGGIQPVVTDYYLNSVNPSNGVLALGTVYTQELDMRAIGDGMWFLGSATNMVGANGSYEAATLKPGLGDTFRLGAGGSTLFFGATGVSNILSDVNQITPSKLLVGAPSVVQNPGPWASGTVVLMGNQNFTGETTVHFQSQLDFRGSLTTSAMKVYGTVNAAGEGGTFINPITNNNIPVTLMPGGFVRLDNTMGVLPVTSTEGRWKDNAPFSLKNNVLRLQGNSAVEVVETVGAITADSGGNRIEVVRAATGRGTELRTPSISRLGNGTLQFIHNGSTLGSDERVIITGAAPTVTNGMVAPWMMSASDIQFVTYNSDTGFTLAGFDNLFGTAATLTSSVSLPNSRSSFTAIPTLNGADYSVYGLRLDADVNLTTASAATDSTNRLIIGSGGLLTNNAARAIQTGIWAGTGGTGELIIYNPNTLNIGIAANNTTSGRIKAASITKTGAGTLQILSEQNDFAGDIRIQQGALQLGYSATIATNITSNLAGTAGKIIFQGNNTSLLLRIGNDSWTVGTTATFNKSIELADGLTVATINVDRNGGAITGRTMIFNNLTFGAGDSEYGQMLRVVNPTNDAFHVQFNGTTTLNGRSVFSIDNNYTGSGNNLVLAGQVTGNGTLIKGPTDSKTRNLLMTNLSTLNNYTGGTILTGGTLQVFARAATVAQNANTNISVGGLGSGDITIMQGTLELRVDTTAIAADGDVEFIRFKDGSGAGPSLFVGGSSVINTDRTGLTTFDSNKMITFQNLTVGSQILTLSQGNSYGLAIAGTTTFTGSPFLNVGAEFVIGGAQGTGAANSIVADGGGAILINKIGTARLSINSANTALNANVYINSGLLDYSNRANANTTASLGRGQIYINPGAAILLRAAANINTGLGQKVSLVGTPYSPSVARLLFGATQSNLETLFASRTTTSNEVQYIAWEATPAAANYDQSLIGDGRVFFGASAGDRTYTGAATGSALIPGFGNLANSIIGGDGANRVYRLGGGDTTARTLTINLTAGNLNDYNGDQTNVQIGSFSILGPTSNYAQGFVLFQNQNTYTGQTVISRNHTLRFSRAMNVGNTAGPLGANAGALIDVYGGLRFDAGGSIFENGSTTNHFYTNLNLKPLSSLVFQDAAATGANSDRWGDDVPVNLDGSYLSLVGANTIADAKEAVGDINFDRGSRIILTYQGTNGDAHLTAKSLNRASASTGAGSGRGTLVFAPTAGANMGLAKAAGTSEARVDLTNAPTLTTGSAIANLLPGYMIEGNTHRFVTYGANGVTPVADGAMVGMPTGAGTGAEVVNLTAATTMGSFETTIFALRGGNFALSSPTGTNNDATLIFAGSGTNVGAVISTASTFTINPNLKFGTAGSNEAFFYTGGNIQLNGNLTAGSVTKFGTGTLVIANDQSDRARGTGNGYQGGWVINEGALQLAQFGAAGNAHANNTIILNGSTASSAQLNLRAQPADTLLNYTYTSGKIYAIDFATIDWDPNAADRVHTISDIEIQQSGGIGNANTNGSLDAYLRVAVANSRNILSAGTLTVANNAILNVDNTATAANFTAYTTNAAYLTNGISSGLSVAALEGSNRLTKWGDGYLYIRGASPSFTGTFVIDQGPVFVANSGSMGSGAVIVNRYGALDIGVAGFTPTNSSITYNEGSIERWSVNGARAGTVDLGKATLQIAANQPTANVAVTLNGGGIQAWQRADDHSGSQEQGGVLRVLNPNVTFNISGNNFLGDRYYEGASGLDSGKQPNDFRPMQEYTASGTILEIKGVISGTGGVTKVGYDSVILSGANTYEGATLVSGGRLLLGVDNALPTTRNLSTTANGVLDLNGQNQTVGKLGNVVETTAVNTTSGYITNSATSIRTLTVGNGVSSGDDFSYSGVIQHNVALTKIGGATVTLNNANTYLGATHINEGTVKLGVNGSINDSAWLKVGAGTTFDVSAKASYAYDGKISGGGSADVAGTAFASLTSAARITGNLIVTDSVGSVSSVGSISPGGNSIAGDITTAGNQIGHIYSSGNLTLSGGLLGSSPVVPVTRMTLQLGGATSNLTTLGYTSGDFFTFIDSLPTLSALSTDTLNGLAGNLSGHDYVNTGGNFTINADGRIVVSYLSGYVPSSGDVFNLLDWTTLTNTTSFTAGPRVRSGGETNYDLLLPALGSGQFWDTSLFLSHGTLVVIPEPGRALLMLLGLMALAFRRRRQD